MAGKTLGWGFQAAMMLAAFVLCGGWAHWGWAQEPFRLQPEEVVVIANRKAAESVGLARYYMKRRGLPEENLIQVWMTDEETCSREEYDRQLAEPVRRALRERFQGSRVRCLVTVRGVPLRVGPSALTAQEKAEKARMERELHALKEAVSGAEKGSQEARRIAKEMEAQQKTLHKLSKADETAAVDSELALVLEPEYPLNGWIPNPMFLGFRKAQNTRFSQRVLMVSRLDGPSAAIVKRLIDDALAAEEKGLTGTAYFDARWPRPDAKTLKKDGMGYGFYDGSIHLAAEAVRKSGRLSVAVDARPEVFQPGQAPRAALYCGWYSLARYIPAFTWVPGAVGYHIASSECETLRSGSSQVWCKRMLEEGAAAVIGPVGEPYVQAFPIPHLFFALLIDGRYTLVEAAFLSLPYLSWQMVVVGDPLYRPFPHR